MKQDYTIAELQAEIAALQQLFDCVTLADPCRGLLDPATLQPLDKVAAVPALDANGAEAHGQSAAARMSVSMGIRTRTMLDKSTRNLATMLAEGSGQGVLDCKRAEKDYPTASPGAMQLCHELGRFQSEAEQTWRGFV